MAEPAASEVPRQEVPKQTDGDQASLFSIGLRDFALVLAGISLWAAADTWYAVSALGFAATISVLNGLLVGAAVGGLLHEWGHFAGARLAGARAPLAPAGGFFPLFNFDMQANDERQFQWMSVGGNLAHWTWLLALVWLLPIDAPGRAALIAGAFGFGMFASTIEFPVIARVYGGTSPMEALAPVIQNGLRRNVGIGAVAALGLFAAL